MFYIGALIRLYPEISRWVDKAAQPSHSPAGLGLLFCPAIENQRKYQEMCSNSLCLDTEITGLIWKKTNINSPAALGMRYSQEVFENVFTPFAVT